MNIVDKRNGLSICKFSDIEVGECFQFNNIIYMKICYATNNFLRVDIKTGQASYFPPDSVVNPLSSEVIIN